MKKVKKPSLQKSKKSKSETSLAPLFIASDHRGYQMKRRLVRYLTNELKIKIEDLGPHTYNETDDYPTYTKLLTKYVVENKGKGILLCKNGIGICVAANKVKDIRAGIGYNIFAAETMMEDDNTNVLCLPSGVLSEDHAMAIVKKWLETKFSNAERHIRRIKEVGEIETGANKYSSVHQMVFLAQKLYVKKGDKVLIMKDRQSNTWDIPGGRLEMADIAQSEKLADALQREFKEETGNVKYKNLKLVTAYLTKSTGMGTESDRPYMVYLIYEGDYVSGDVKLSVEHSKYEWVTFKQLKKCPFGRWSILRDSYLKAVGKF